MPKAAKIHRSVKRPNANDAAKRRQRKRYYATYQTEWLNIRRNQLNRQPLCEDHLSRGYVREASVVDHIDGDASTFESNRPSNLMSLCKSCHSRKTAIHDGGFGR